MRVKLISQVLSYTIAGFTFTQKEPILDVPDEIATKLMNNDNVILLDDNSDVNNDNVGGTAVDTAVSSDNINSEENSDEDANATYDFAKKTVAELDAFAQEIGLQYSATNLNKTQKIDEINQFIQENK